MAFRITIILIGGFLLAVLAKNSVYAQYNIQHTSPVAMERGQSNPLEFTVSGLTTSEVREARLFYRYDGDFSYQQQEVEIRNSGIFSTSINIDNSSASSVEYYLEIILSSGEGLYYPNNLPSENPVRVEIVDEAERESKRSLEDVEYTILSPTPGNAVTRENVVIAIALFYEADKLQDGEFKLFIDQQDVTAMADTSAYYFSYIPKGLRPGQHTIALEYHTDDEAFSVTEWSFRVVASGEATFAGFAQSSKIPQGSVELTGRNQVIAGDINNAYTGRTRISGRYGLLKYSANGYLTSQEDPRLQPQNRYGIDLELGKWINFEAGHVYPSLSQFTISGRRVHGINTSVHLANENINIHFITGELDRRVTNQYDSLVVTDVLSSTGTVVDNKYYLTYKDGGRGTFKRQVLGGRFSLGREDKFQIGLNALKIQDDTTSIFNVRNYTNIVNNPLPVTSQLNSVQRDSLMANPDLLDIRGGSVRPRDNFVAGADLKFALDNNRIQFRSEGVISALNNNIYGGPLDSLRADDLGFELDNSTINLLERVSWLIIVNENMSTLPLDIYEDDNGDVKADAYFPTSILAGNGELSFRYPINNLRLQYRWIGPDFNSLANSTVRRDIAGFTLTDRFNLLSNRLYLTLGYENLNDNVNGARDATTTTVTYRTNVSWYPIDRSLPRVTAGMRYRSRDNEVKKENYLVGLISEDLVDAAVLNIRQQLNSQDSLVTVVSPRARRNNTVNFNTSITQQFDAFDARNDASISISNLNTTDEVFAFGDVKSTAISLNLTSRFNSSPFESQLGFTYNNTESGSGQTKINILGFYGGGEVRLMESKLFVSARLAITQNEATSTALKIVDNPNSDVLNDNPNDNYYVLSDDPGDISTNNFNTYVFQSSSRYNFDDNNSLVFDASFTNVGGANSANDRIVQLRYVYRF